MAGLTDLVVLVRLPSCVGGAVSVLLGAYLATGSLTTDGGRLALAAAAIALVVAVANVVNDIADLDLDRIGKPGRPLPRGSVPVSFAGVLAAILALTAIALTIPLGAAMTLALLALTAFAVSYSLWFKRTVLVGNVVVAACASFPVGFGAAVARESHPPVVVAIGLAFLFMFSYETLKTRTDRESDARSGIRTFATVWGARASVRLFRVLIGTLTLAVVAGTVVTSRPFLYAPAALTVCGFAVASAIHLPVPENDPAAMRHSVFLMRVAWFLGVGALWLLR
ncbi:prenyltransferase [Acrocarpospora phusangensis]|uniref:Prenyltransferase n=1 Tax=Acrocarpospora phusangensis TaxID=1070424 RepID=A0A919QKH7_9ACTN|nr:UbiA family prenyltransferase [Acrocarpospora phusangensis]GIH29130.1 prenyltransferase [Acrocarpospora phusangensis]